ncbi:MAG: DEAD/DEAH box helicase, partial [Dehalococcoidia bacterium]|nr:DEAD/DEAH box helicase [Dehalococcoidia bacterium]
DGVGRELDFGRAIGAFTRELEHVRDEEAVITRLRTEHDLDERSARNLLAYLQEEKQATGALPTDRTIVVQRFRDELGDWRMVLLTPFGGRVHAPWAQAIEAVLTERTGFDIQTIWSDDGIAIRFAGGDDLPAEDLLFPSPEEVEELVVNRLADTPLFASHFRENAGRALLLPRRRPGARTPLWQQRLRSANLLAVASRYGSFPVILETYRECLRDVFDLPGLQEILAAIRSREIKVRSVETQEASPFARSLLFDYIAAYMYEGDAPLAERRAQALALDRNLLRDLLGDDELRELLDPEALDQLELELQALVENRKARNVDQLHDLLRRLGDLTTFEVEARVTHPEQAGSWLKQLEAERRACLVRIGGEERWIPIEDAGRFRDALGVAPPLGVPEVFLQYSVRPLEGLVARYARTHAPFLARDVATRWTVPESLVRTALDALEREGTLVHGDFRPRGHEREWCDADVLRQLRKRSLARLRKEVEPVPQDAFARFLSKWQGLGSTHAGIDRLREVLGQLEALPLPASVLERDVLPVRVADYQPRLLDELGAAGEVAWIGRGQLGRDDGRVALFRRDHLADLAPPPSVDEPGELAAAILDYLRDNGASFFTELVRAAKTAHPRDALDALWELAWSGRITNDTFAPLRALAWPRRGAPSPRASRSLVPPEAAGRWSVVRSPGLVNPTARAHALATALLERYGVVTREAVAAEGIAGGFGAVYPVLKAMEESGRVRRGYFVEGLGAAQFALPGAVDRLRAERDRPEEPQVYVLAATDPANPYGAALPWPRREGERRPLQRSAGSRVVLVAGVPVLYLDRGGRSLVTLPAFDDPEYAAPALERLVDLAASAGGRPFALERIDGEPADQSPQAQRFIDAGFAPTYRGLAYRPTRKEPAIAGRG